MVTSGGIAMFADASERMTEKLSVTRYEHPVSCELNRAPRHRRRYEIHSVPLPVSKVTIVLAVSTTTDTDVDTARSAKEEPLIGSIESVDGSLAGQRASYMKR